MKHSLCLDHDHTTGELRKFLCNRCNMIVGVLESSGDTVVLAWQYIEDYFNGNL